MKKIGPRIQPLLRLTGNYLLEIIEMEKVGSRIQPVHRLTGNCLLDITEMEKRNECKKANQFDYFLIDSPLGENNDSLIPVLGLVID